MIKLGNVIKELIRKISSEINSELKSIKTVETVTAINTPAHPSLSRRKNKGSFTKR